VVCHQVRIWDYFRKVKDDLIILSKQTDEVEDSEMEHEVSIVNHLAHFLIEFECSFRDSNI
jgi:hypothetical protein